MCKLLQTLNTAGSKYRTALILLTLLSPNQHTTPYTTHRKMSDPAKLQANITFMIQDKFIQPCNKLCCSHSSNSVSVAAHVLPKEPVVLESSFDPCKTVTKHTKLSCLKTPSKALMFLKWERACMLKLENTFLYFSWEQKSDCLVMLRVKHMPTFIQTESSFPMSIYSN